jgi:hypothetical protein
MFLGFCLFFASIATCMVFLEPAAAGSGITVLRRWRVPPE